MNRTGKEEEDLRLRDEGGIRADARRPGTSSLDECFAKEAGCFLSGFKARSGRRGIRVFHCRALVSPPDLRRAAIFFSSSSLQRCASPSEANADEWYVGRRDSAEDTDFSFRGEHSASTISHLRANAKE